MILTREDLIVIEGALVSKVKELKELINIGKWRGQESESYLHPLLREAEELLERVKAR